MQIKKLYIILIAVVLMLSGLSLHSQMDFYVSPNAVVHISPDAVVRVNGSVIIDNNGTFTQQNNSSLYVTNNFQVIGTFTSSNGTTYFIGSDNSTLSGGGTTTFYTLVLNKDLNTLLLLIDKSLTINNNLDITQGWFRLLNNAARAINLFGNLNISSNGLFDASITGTATHQLNFYGLFNNNGIIDFNTTGGNVVLNLLGTTNVNLAGTGSYDFYEVNVNKSNPTNYVNFDKVFTAADNFLTLTQGEFRLTSNYSITNNFFKLTGTDYTIPENSAFILDNPNVTVAAQSIAGNGILKGKLHVKQGEFNLGGTGESNLVYDRASGYAELDITGGNVNIRTALYPENSSRLLRLSIANGNLNIGTGSSNSNNKPTLDIPNVNSIFNFLSGNLRIHRGNTNVGLDDIRILADNDTVAASSVLEINDMAASQTIEINSAIPIGTFLVNANNAPSILLKNNLQVMGNATFNGSGSNLFNTQSYNLLLNADFINNFGNNNGFNNSTGRVVFNGNTDQNISGTQQTTFNILQLNKTAGRVEVNTNSRVNASIRFISNSILDVNNNKITMAAGTRVYSDDGITYEFDTFNDSKCIVVQNTSQLVGGSLEFELNPSQPLPYEIHYPITTEGVYTPMKIRLLPSGVSYGANPKINIRQFAGEHPKVEAPNISLKKYWIIKTNDLTVNTHGAEVVGIYNDSEVEGSEGSYQVLAFSPNYNDPEGYWRVNPGVNNYVNNNTNLWYSQQTNFLDGDWTVGEQPAGQATYYARANGDYNDPNTWSKVYFNGTPSSTAPNKRSDRVRIQDHIVSITDSVAVANLISVEVGTEGRINGTLQIESNHYVKGDTFKLEQNCKLYFAHQDGITISPNQIGAIRTNNRIMSNNAIYIFWQGQNQVSGNGVPDLVQSIVIDKSAGSTATLSKNIGIRDSLVIVNGILDLATFSVNGYTPGRTFKMYGGEMIVRSNYPLNYTPPFLTAGRITFDGVGNAIIPSETSIPGVAQYNNLKIAGASRAGNITFENSGKIRILGDFDISELNFANNTYRFFTSGSTVRFVKNGNQNISFTPNSPTDSVCQIQFFNLELINSGNKSIIGTSPYPFSINNQLTLDSAVTFVQNNANIEIQGHWTNLNGSVFQPTAGKFVSFFAPTNTVDLNITARDTTDNNFEDVIIRGPGNVKPLDNFVVNGNISILSGTNFIVNGVDIFLYRNWTNTGGTFTQTNSTAYFQGNTTQSITKSSGNETFYNLVLRNPEHLNINGIGGSTNGLIITNNLSLNHGRINGRDRFVQVNGEITRTGGGYINSGLRRNLPAGTSSLQYEVGYEEVYTPLTLHLNGSGGTAGIVQVKSDTITTTTSPISWTDATPTDISPLGSQISPIKHIARQWNITRPSGSTFALGTRKYDAVMYFVGLASPAGDLRGGMSQYLADAKIYNGTNWIGPFYYGTFPYVGTRQNDSLEFKEITDFGSIIVGEPSILTYYTRNSGNWKNTNNWSAISYNGPAATSYPGQLGPNFRALIGASHQITLDTNLVVNNAPPNVSIVTVDSSGVLDLSTNTISGTGEFRLFKYGTIRIGSPDGITASSATGNIRTTTRSYNYNNHNLGTFVYNGAGAQNTGDGLPSGTDSIRVLIINKPSGTLTLNAASNISIKDSLFIQSGTFNSGNRDITLLSHFRINSNASFVPNSRTLRFTGNLAAQLVTAPAANLTFSRIIVDKNQDSSFVKFMPTAAGNAYNILVDSIIFTANNKAYIDLSPKYTIAGYPDYNQGEWFMTMNNNSTNGINRLGRGHIQGELRKFVPAGIIATVPNGIRFEIGNSVNYRPFVFNFTSTGGTAGYYGVHSVPFYHPESDYLSNPNFALVKDRIIRNYWRVTKTTVDNLRGTRTMAMTAQYVNPGDIPPGTTVQCFDLAYWRGTSSSDWQRLTPSNTSFNNGAGTGCGSRDIRGGEATYIPHGTDSSTTAYNIAGTYLLGNYNLSLSQNNRYLVADVIVGQQGPSFTKFYTRQSGNWNDPNTWSTSGYNGPAATIFPRERLHAAFIGENHKVTLNVNIGNSYIGATGSQYQEQRLGSLRLEKTPNGVGYLSLGTFVIRTYMFEMEDGCFIETGAEDGFHSSVNRGNIIRQAANAGELQRNYNYGSHNNGNFIFNPKGRITETWDNTNFIYPSAYGLQNGGRRINSVTLLGGGPTYTNNEFGYNGWRYYPYYVFTLTAGQNYTFRVNLDGNVGNWYATIFVDRDFSGDHNAGEASAVALRQGSNNYIDVAVSIPANTPQGTTQMRIIMRDVGGVPNPNSPGTGNGDAEDYTVYIVNPNFRMFQSTGGAIPSQIASMTINADSAGRNVVLNSDISIKDSLVINSGRFSPGSFSLKVQGDIVNNSRPDALDSIAIFTIEMNGNRNQNIRGTQSTNFYNLLLRNQDSIINLRRDILVRNQLSFETNCRLNISGANLIMDTNSTQISPGTGAFSGRRMVYTNGTDTTKSIVKRFLSTGGAANPKTFTFPIGIDTSYYPVYVRDTAVSWSGTPEMRVSVFAGQHPQRLTSNILNIYWRTRFANWNTNLDTIQFSYRPHNVTGDTNKYIPSMWDGNNWHIDLGNQPWAKTSPIIIKNTTRFQASNPLNFAEWTAGQPITFSSGRKFYSINNGQWNNFLNWSTDTLLKHSGLAASYYPGDLFDDDTVHIDGHTITFSLDSCRVDSICIGGTNPSPTAGMLEFANTASGKKLFTRQLFIAADNGVISPISAGTNIDSLIISKDIINNSIAPGGFDFQNGSHILALKFVGTGNSNISGTGVWQDINRVVLQKSGGLADSLILNSTSFATASLSGNPNFIPLSGVIKSNSGLNTRIASATNDLTLQPNSGIHTFNGSILAERNLLASSGSTIRLDNGNLLIGNATDRNFIYSSGSQIVINNAQMSIAGGFLRSVPTATTNLSLNHPNSAVIAGRIGYTGIDPTFDLQNSGSVLNMTNGRIIVANGNINSTSDINISAAGGSGITGGDIQLGDSALTTSAHPFRFSGLTPIYNLHLVNDAAETTNYVSSLTSLEYIVKNDIIVDKKQDLNINGNTLTLQGNLIVHGKVTATPASPSSLSWRMILNGTNDQYFRNYNSAQPVIEIYSLRIAKNTGNLILGGGGSTHSNLKVNDHLEFLGSNNAFIDSRTNNFKVLVGPNSANLGIYQISRPNLGHISGKLSRYIPNGSQTIDFVIGLDTIGAYRPVQIVTTGSSNTAGYVESIVYKDDHPDIANSTLLPTTNVPRYWAVNRDIDFGAFNLGTGGKYRITTTFKNPDDVPNPSSLSLFEHRLFSPSYPASGSWSTPSFVSNTSTSVTSQNLTIWGDFVVGEPNTVTFYSIQDGNWQNINTWSLSGYTIPNPPTRIPNLNTDIVRIGNGKTVTLLDDGTYPNVRNIIVETYNGNPGYLQINGQFNYLRGLIFQLDDGNSLGIQHVDGLRPITDGNIGAIQTNSRNFGISRYIFNSTTGNQITGTALPNYVQSIIVDNSSPTANKKVFLSNFPGAPQVNIRDSLFIRQGVFNFGNRNIRLLGQFVIDSIFNDGKTEPLSSKLIMDSTTDKNIVIRNRSGVNLFDLQLVNGNTLTVKREGSNVTNQSHLNVAGTLEFTGATMVILGDSTNLQITNTDVNAILNFASDRFIRTSRTSGSLVRSFSNIGLPKTYIYPIGSFEGGNNYARAEVTISSMTTPGKLGIRTSPGDYGGFPGGHARLSASPNAEYLKRYWTIDSVTSNFTGLVRFYYNQPEVYGYESNYSRLGRWNPVREQDGGLWTQFFNPTIDSLANYFQTTSGFASTNLTGDWTLGNLYAFRRIFFSRQSGNWNDPNSWTYSPTHSGPIFGPGLWPDNSLDSAVIGGGNGDLILPHEIVLNLNANIQGTALGTSPTNRGILNTNFNVLSGQYFTMADYSHLKITSPDGITTIGNASGNIQTTDSRAYNNALGIFEYNGNSNQSIGNGLPSTVWNLITNNSGPVTNNIVTLDKNLSIQNNLTINQGVLNLATYTANNINGVGLFTVNANARLMVGGGNNLSLAISNYSTYNVDIDSYIEFSGNSNQQIDLLPPNLITGLGNVDLTNIGIKIVDNPLLIRGNLRNNAPATLLINAIDALQVHKNVVNHSAIINNGILEIGQ